jgi:hypothetical protein
MSKYLLGILLVMAGSVYGQDTTSWLAEIEQFQKEQNAHYTNKKTSPLSRKERKKFEGHRFYPIDLSYRVTARFERIVEEDTVIMQTSSGREKYYRPFAYVHFKLNGQACQLTVYQSYLLRETKEYKDYLFIPFRDETSGKTSYGGGRYLDVLIPEGNSILLNFNLAYNPYCAYTTGYNCTIPPAENTLKVAVKAGLMAPPTH